MAGAVSFVFCVLGVNMNTIKSIYIEGFKKFKKIKIDLNSNVNILVGENEAGKSSIVEAVKIVLSQQYKNADKTVLMDLFNAELLSEFRMAPSFQTLPYIVIEIELELSEEDPKSSNFYGESYCREVYADVKGRDKSRYGIRFDCKIDECARDEVSAFIQKGKVPYEYYLFSWKTFAGQTYQAVRRPLNYVFIDTSKSSATYSFNYYNKSLFASVCESQRQLAIRGEFREGISDIFDRIKMPDLGGGRKFGVDCKKIIFENVLSIYDGSIPLENRGSGMENYIKTKIALERNGEVSVIIIEEPENHLSYTSLLKMLREISDKGESSQLLVTTHSNMIASRLSLMNVLWVRDSDVQKLSNLERDTADFFMRADHNSFLEVLLAKKLILVEGATEFLLLPKLYKNIVGRTIEEDEVTVVSCNGITYNHYLEISKLTKKRIAVITDNDGNEEKIEEAKRFNSVEKNQHIFMDNDPEKWTWEVCLYHMNKSMLDHEISVKAGAKYLYYGQNYGQVLGKMLKNKVDVAYEILKCDFDIVPPDYVVEAIKWLNE